MNRFFVVIVGVLLVMGFQPSSVMAACDSSGLKNCVDSQCDDYKPGGPSDAGADAYTECLAMYNASGSICSTNYDCDTPTPPSGGGTAPTGGSSGKLNLIPTKLGDSAGYDTSEGSSLTLMILKIVKGFMGLLGIAAVVLVVYAGFLWMTAGGEEEKVKTAKKILVQATIGLAIILMSYAISSFVIGSIVGATTGEVSATIP